MPRIKNSPNMTAYNAAIDALNAADRDIEYLVEERDKAFLAAQALIPLKAQGAKGLRRDFVSRNGKVRFR